jgi:hypothetical protein
LRGAGMVRGLVMMLRSFIATDRRFRILFRMRTPLREAVEADTLNTTSRGSLF